MAKHYNPSSTNQGGDFKTTRTARLAKSRNQAMIVVNFSHPLTEPQLAAIAERSGHAVERVIDTPVHFDEQRGYAEQAQEVVTGTGLSSRQWQSESLVVNLPGHSAIAAVLLAELHGRIGHFPTVVHLRPVAGSTPIQYELAELLPLQEIRNEQARGSRDR